jgi:hypothetical protein
MEESGNNSKENEDWGPEVSTGVLIDVPWPLTKLGDPGLDFT